MNVTLSKILGVAVILIALGALLEIVVKDDSTHASSEQEVATAVPAATGAASSDSTVSSDDSSQRPFAMFPSSKQQLAPDFTLKTADGGSVSLSRAVKAGPVLIDFWATWCGPCRAELPTYESMYKKYKAKGFQFYTINSSDSPGDIRSFAQGNGLTMPMLVDASGDVANAYGVNAIPVTLVIDGDRKCVAGSMGYDPGMEQDLPPTLDQLIAQIHSTAVSKG